MDVNHSGTFHLHIHAKKVRGRIVAQHSEKVKKNNKMQYTSENLFKVALPLFLPDKVSKETKKQKPLNNNV